MLTEFKRYYVSRDNQGGSFAMGRTQTALEWLKDVVMWHDNDKFWSCSAERQKFIELWTSRIESGAEDQFMKYVATEWNLEFDYAPIRYKTYAIEHAGRVDYRIYDPLSPAQTIGYTDSIEYAVRVIDKQCPEREEVCFTDSYGKPARFIVTDKFPNREYHVWTIGDKMVPGFLPLCKSAPAQTDFDKPVDMECLAAIDMTDRPDVLNDLVNAAFLGARDLESAYEVLGRIANNPMEKKHYELVNRILPVLEEFSEHFRCDSDWLRRSY